MLHDDKLTIRKIAHFSFSGDSKSCLVLGNEPESYLTVWSIEKKAPEIVSSMKLGTSANEKKKLHCTISPEGMRSVQYNEYLTQVINIFQHFKINNLHPKQTRL